MCTMHLMQCFIGPHRFCLRFALCVTTQQNATVWGVAHPGGGYDPKLELGWDFCAMHLPPSFIIPHLLVQKLSCWHTNPPTNSRCRKHPTFFATLWLGNKLLSAQDRQGFPLQQITHHAHGSKCIGCDTIASWACSHRAMNSLLL